MPRSGTPKPPPKKKTSKTRKSVIRGHFSFSFSMLGCMVAEAAVDVIHSVKTVFDSLQTTGHKELPDELQGPDEIVVTDIEEDIETDEILLEEGTESDEF